MRIKDTTSSFGSLHHRDPLPFRVYPYSLFQTGRQAGRQPGIDRIWMSEREIEKKERERGMGRQIDRQTKK